MTKKQSIPKQTAVGCGKSVYRRKEKFTGACSEFLAAAGEKNENLQVLGWFGKDRLCMGIVLSKAINFL